MPKVSILVPVYTAGDWVTLTKRNLDSIAIQDYRDYEVVVSDDSDDGQLYEWLKGYTHATGLEVTYEQTSPAADKGMASNTNRAWDMATGDLVKILYQDDYFYRPDSLGHMVRAFTPKTYWMAATCLHTYDGLTLFNEHRPYYSTSENTVGSPSVTMFLREIPDRFDPNFDWVFDLDLYRRLFQKYGVPKIVARTTVVIGLHPDQMTNKLSDEQKINEQIAYKEKYNAK